MKGSSGVTLSTWPDNEWASLAGRRAGCQFVSAARGTRPAPSFRSLLLRCFSRPQSTSSYDTDPTASAAAAAAQRAGSHGPEASSQRAHVPATGAHARSSASTPHAAPSCSAATARSAARATAAPAPAASAPAPPPRRSSAAAPCGAASGARSPARHGVAARALPALTLGANARRQQADEGGVRRRACGEAQRVAALRSGVLPRPGRPTALLRGALRAALAACRTRERCRRL